MLDQLIARQPVITAKNRLLQKSLDSMAVPGILVDHCLIADGDDCALLPEELAAFANSAIKVRRASGAARVIARELLSQLGQTQRAIPKSLSGMPIWPSGIVGSLAHDPEIAVAALGMRRDFASIGIDIEPAQALDSDLLDIVATAKERARIREDPCHGRLLFAVKEAVYKAVYPMDGLFLDHHDVEVCLAARTAEVRNGRVVTFRYCIATHIVALAFISASPAEL